MESKFVHQIIATHDFPHQSELDRYKRYLRSLGAYGKAGIRNPESGIRNPESGIRNPEPEPETEMEPEPEPKLRPG